MSPNESTHGSERVICDSTTRGSRYEVTDNLADVASSPHKPKFREACLSCGHFATDATHLAELRDQHTKTTALITLRREQYHARSGRELTDDNVWIAARLRELHSLNAILAWLSTEEAAHAQAISGAGTTGRLPLAPIATRGAHNSVLRKADPPTAHDRHPSLPGRPGRSHPETAGLGGHTGLEGPASHAPREGPDYAERCGPTRGRDPAKPSIAYR